MNISIKRSGGFAGVTEDLGTINTAQLDATRAQQVEQMVQDIGFFNLPAMLSSGIGADLMRYEVTVIDGNKQHTVAFEDDDGPETAPLRRLVESLTRMG